MDGGSVYSKEKGFYVVGRVADASGADVIKERLDGQRRGFLFPS